MKMQYYCINCLSAQITEAIEMVIPEWDRRKVLIKEVLDYMHKFYPDAVAADVGSELHRMVIRASGRDPYAEIKKAGNSLALEVFKQVEDELSDFYSAVRAAIAANAIDFGVQGQKEAMYKIQDLIKEPLVLNDFEKFNHEIDKSENIVYLIDNCGEVVFDLQVVKLLAGMNKKVYSVAKESPLLNDATIKELNELGFGKYSEIISSGGDLVGLKRDEMPERLKEVWHSSDIIISKGMGYYEFLHPPEANEKIAFLLKAKCKPIARDLNVEVGSNVLLFP